MRQFKPYTLVYVIAAVAFATFGFESNNFSVLAVGLVTFIIALCSSRPWWYRRTIALGKNNVISGWIVIVILIGLQVYGLVSKKFGLSPLLISILILRLIASVDAIHTLRGSSESVRQPGNN